MGSFGVFLQMRNTENPNVSVSSIKNNASDRHSAHFDGRLLVGGVDEEIEGVQSNERWAYVKVNMDGVTIGRKICVLDHGGYSSLALQLEDMFGRQNQLCTHFQDIF